MMLDDFMEVLPVNLKTSFSLFLDVKAKAQKVEECAEGSTVRNISESYMSDQHWSAPWHTEQWTQDVPSSEGHPPGMAGGRISHNSGAWVTELIFQRLKKPSWGEAEGLICLRWHSDTLPKWEDTGCEHMFIFPDSGPDGGISRGKQ
ncbi:hypothetical protein CapIbe_022827 [Capra ibex]